MTRRGDVLDANLARLLVRAYRPVAPSDVFRRRVELLVAERAAGRPAHAATGLAARRHLLPVAAVASLLGIFLASVWWSSRGPGAAPTAGELVARGDVAVRAAVDGPWRPLDPRELAGAGGALALEGAYLEVATPAELPAALGGALAVRAAPASGARVAPDSGVRFARADGRAGHASDPAGDWIADLRRGAVDVARDAGDDAGCELRTPHGRLRLARGELAAELVPPAAAPPDVAARAGVLAAGDAPATLLRARLRSGAAELLGSVDGGSARPLPVGVDVWVRAGRTLAGLAAAGDPRPGGDAPAAGGARTPLGAEPSATAAEPPAGGAALELRVDGAADRSLLVTLLREVQLPEVAFPDPREVRADARGRVRVEGLRPGRYDVFVRAEDFAVLRFDDEVLAEGETAALEGALDRGVTVRGRVVSAATGEPVAGALVLNEHDAAAQVLPFGAVEDEYPPELVHTVATDERGRFELRRAGPRLMLRAWAPGHGPAWLASRAAAGDVVEDLELALAPGGRVEGDVRRPDGSPWSGARLVLAATDMMGQRPCMSYTAAVTDVEGRFAAGDLPAGPLAVVLVEGGPEAPTPAETGGALPSVMIVDVRVGETTSVRLPGGGEEGRIFGRTLDPRGQPVPELTVSLERLDADTAVDGWQGVRADGAGNYELTGLEPGRYRVGVGVDMDGDVVLVEEIELAGGEERLLDLLLPAGVLRGRVVAREGGAPVYYAAVVLEHVGASGDPFAGKTLTERDGTFVLGHLAPGRYHVSVYPTDTELATQLVGEVDVPPGPSEPLAVELLTGGTLRVEVVDAEGEPVERASVQLEDPRGRAYYVSWRPWTDAAGVLEVPSLPPGELAVVVRREGFAEARVAAVVAPGTATPLRVELARAR